MNPFVIISLVVYNGEPFLEACLKSIYSQTYRNFSLVITDNASQDGSVVLIRTLTPQAILICERENTGFSRAHNRVIRESDSDMVFILNQDCVLEEWYLEQCVEAFQSDSTLSSVSGSLARMNGLTENRGNGTIDTLGLCMRRVFHTANLGSGLPISCIPQKKFPVFGVSATAALYLRQALESVAHKKEGCKEYFDEDFFMYKEDIDLAFRLYQSGWNALCEPLARGYHVRSTEQRLFSRPSQDINALSYRNHFLFLVKNITPEIALKYGLRIMFYELAKFFYMIAREPSSLPAIARAWKLRRRILQKRPAVFRRFRAIPFGCNISTYVR